ncbi:MAG: glycosyltransferase family 4 protein [Candidatus Zixiibacteriota bacterium]
MYSFNRDWKSLETATRPRPCLLLVCPRIVATFVRQDAALLSEDFDVTMFPYMGWPSLVALWRAVRRAELVLIWFAGRHAVPAVAMARRRRLPSVTVIGGYEAAWVSEVRYGIPPGSLRERILRRLLRASDLILTVSEFSDRATKDRFPEVSGRMRCIKHAIDVARFRTDPANTRDRVICVGSLSRSTIRVKGWPLFWEVAARMPHVQFVAIGPARDRVGREFVASRPDNLDWRGELTGDDLLREFQSAAVYFQGSRHESFCVALAEAMACGCVPAVSRCGALPEVAGKEAFFFDPTSPEEAVHAVGQALAVPVASRAGFQQRVIDLFSLERRRSELVEAMDALLQRTSQATAQHRGT